MNHSALETRKARRATWFEALRDDICAAFEALEDTLPANAPFADRSGWPLRPYAMAAHRS